MSISLYEELRLFGAIFKVVAMGPFVKLFS